MSSSSSRKIAAANGFGRSSLTVKEAWALYHAGYPVPPDMRLPSSGGWKMAVNGIGIPPPPTPGTERWKDAIRARRDQLDAEERADPTWAAKNNDAWWATYFKGKYDQEASQAALLAEYERQQRLIASSDDPEDCPELRAAFLASLNDKDAWRGDIETAIAMSIRDSGKPLMDLTDDGEAGPSGLVKDEPDERVKQEVVTDDMYNFHRYYDASGRRKFF